MSGGSATPFLSLDGVTKTFASGTQALAPVSLDIATGSLVAIVGPSGCGKSTLLRLIAKLSEPTSGTIKFAHESGKMETGFVFQDATLMPWATVESNVALPLSLAGRASKGQSKVDEVLSWVGLTNFRHSYPRELSGGMRMRVSIARALITEPSLLLLDEPFAALDEFTRAQLNEDLLALRDKVQWTGLFVTHSIREAVFLADRVIVMSPRPGRIVADVNVPFSAPRTANLKDDHEFSDLCSDIAKKLAFAMSEDAA